MTVQIDSVPMADSVVSVDVNTLDKVIINSKPMADSTVFVGVNILDRVTINSKPMADSAVDIEVGDVSVSTNVFVTFLIIDIGE